jgi:glycosyltransferase involved in cell wall biosynthesis
MRIRIVCQEGFSPQYTGGGSYLNQLYRYLTFHDYLKLTEPNDGGILRELLTPVTHASAKKQILQSLQDGESIDLVHNNNVLSMPNFPDVPVVTTVHHVHFKMIEGPNGLLPNIKYYPQERLMLKNSDYVIAVSEFTRNRLQRYYHYPADHLYVIPNGINTDLFHARSHKEKRTIIFPNALRYPQRKGTYFILPFLQEILRSDPDLTFIFTGLTSPEGEAILKSLPSNFQYLGFIDERDLSMLYQSACCVLFPSRYEGYGLVPLEVIASGGIVLSSDVGAVRTYLQDGKNGFILPDDPTRWKETVQAILADDTLRASIRRNNRSYIVRSWKECAEDHRRCFENILTEPGSQSP